MPPTGYTYITADNYTNLTIVTTHRSVVDALVQEMIKRLSQPPHYEAYCPFHRRPLVLGQNGGSEAARVHVQLDGAEREVDAREVALWMMAQLCARGWEVLGTKPADVAFPQAFELVFRP
jgi:hypothetical protein